MKNKSKKIVLKGTSLVLAGVMLSSLTGCGNRQLLDFNKSFNVAVEPNNGYISIVAINAYSDYEGDQVQFVTEDGLRVLTSTHQTELIKTQSADSIYKYALMLSGNDDKKVNDYNKMQGVCIDTSKDNWNKDIIDWHFKYNKAIILSDNTATIARLDTWKDYKDDKIQLKFKDGNCLLTNIDNIKLINDLDAKEDSLYNYALSLVGSDERINYYDDGFSMEKVK